MLLSLLGPGASYKECRNITSYLAYVDNTRFDETGIVQQPEGGPLKSMFGIFPCLLEVWAAILGIVHFGDVIFLLQLKNRSVR